MSYSGNKPSAPPAPYRDEPQVAYPYQPPPPPPPNPSSSSSSYAPNPIAHTHTHTHSGSFGSDSSPHAPHAYGYYQPQPPPPPTSVYSSFPPGTHPDVIRSFQMVDGNHNGYIEEKELQEALAWNYQKFSRSTLRLLIFLFRNPRESSSIIG